VADLADIVRRERPRIVGALLRASGSIDVAEEAFQDAVVAALASWPVHGVPDNPAAWLTAAAKNRVRDAHRHRSVVDEKAPLLAEDPMQTDVQTISDDQLRLIFTCCHPELPREAQVALTLKVIAGFSTEELARAFLVPEVTMAQRIVRAKRTIEQRHLGVAEPGTRDLGDRLAAVLEVVYLIFNEGHTAREGALVRVDLQAEALRLGRELADLLPREPEVYGLVALMAFAAARATTRTDADGVLLRLSEQDRGQWHVGLIEEGLHALARARTLGGGIYTLQAEIAACHVTAPSWEATDFARIVTIYGELQGRTGSPVVALNRAIAIAMRDGPAAGLAELGELEEPLARYHLFYATRADLLTRLGRDGRADYERALELATNDSEREFLRRQLAR
jgi:RNA polymerase sigma factor (sigma-70 family)